MKQKEHIRTSKFGKKFYVNHGNKKSDIRSVTVIEDHDEYDYVYKIHEKINNNVLLFDIRKVNRNYIEMLKDDEVNKSTISEAKKHMGQWVLFNFDTYEDIFFNTKQNAIDHVNSIYRSYL